MSESTTEQSSREQELRGLLREWQQAYNRMDDVGVSVADFQSLRRRTHEALSSPIAITAEEAGREGIDAEFKEGAVEEILRTYLALHKGKLGAHWMWCAIEQLVAGIPEAEVMSDYGYFSTPPSAPGNGEGDAKDAVCYANPVILLPADEGDEGVEWTAKVQGNADETFSLPLFYRPVSEWQPIETCPSDEVVLLYTPDLHPTNPERIESRIYHCTKGGTMHAWATHWMALPAPPAMPSAPAQSGGQGNG